MRRGHFGLRPALALLVAVALSSGLAACSTPTATTPSETGSAAPTAGEPRTLKFLTYTGGDAGEKWVWAADAFEAANPGVTVEIEVVTGDDTYNTLVRSRIQGGTSPDIFEGLNGLPGLKQYVDAGMLTDLSSEEWLDRQISGVRDAADYFDGKTYQYISYVDASGVIYNKDIFEANGIDIPTDWVSFEAAADKLKAAGITPIALGAKDGWTIVNLVGQLIQNKPAMRLGADEWSQLAAGTLPISESTSFPAALETFGSLIDRGAFDPNASGVTWPASADDFANGKAGMLVLGTFALASVLEANPDINLGMFPLPYNEAGEDPSALIGYGGLLAIPATAPNADLAKEFLDFMAQEDTLSEFLTKASAFSPIEGASGETSAAVEGIVPAVEQNAVLSSWTLAISAEARAALQTGVQGMVAGTHDVQAVLKELDAAEAK